MYADALLAHRLLISSDVFLCFLETISDQHDIGVSSKYKIIRMRGHESRK